MFFNCPKIYCFPLIFLCFVYVVNTSKAESSKSDGPRLLILNSYHPGYPWSDHELTGIIETIKQKYPQSRTEIEYLDFKKFNGQEYLTKLKELYLFKYKRQKIDLVMTIDDLALDFALRHRADIFPTTPIVFCGVNDFSTQMIEGQARVTGVAEKLDIKKTVKTALKLHPRTREILVIHDYTATGLKTRDEMENIVPMFSSQVNFRFIENLAISKIALELESLPNDTLILILSYSRDRTGKVFTHQDVARLFRQHSPVPIYGVHEERLGSGVIGGSLQGGQPHGESAAELALQVLAGEEQIPVRLETTARLMFDFNELNRFSVSLKNLPQGSVVINQPETFYTKYKKMFFGTFFVSVVLTICLGILALNIIKRRRVEKSLHSIEWLLKKAISPHSKHQYSPPYGDLVALNTKRVLLDSVGQKTLTNIVGDFLDLLDSSSAVYETNGDYALGIFSSGWCRFLDNASRNLCATDDNKEALESGLWLCHESCWTDASKAAIETGQPTDIECHGGIRLYAIPIRSGEEIVGAINVGYGTPPTDRQRLQEIAEKYDIPLEELLEKAAAYEERPKYIMEIAKKRLHSAARLIGEIVERKRVEEKLWQSQDELEQRVELRTTELKKSKEEWENTFEAIGDIATIQDLSLRILRVNQKACDAFNAKPDELIGKFCYELFREATEPCQGCPVVQGVKDYRIHSTEIRHERLGKTFMVSASPVVGANGKITSIVHFAKDITEQKNLEKRLSQAQKMEAIGTLAGGIAHDFNNILAPILGYADMALGTLAPDSSTASEIQEVIKAGNRAKELVKQILAFSRQSEHELRPLKIQLVVREALKLLRASIPTTIEIRQNIDPECSAVLADPTQIHQVVMNLCTNAYHAMRETGGVLAVALAPVELGPDVLTTKIDLLAGLYVQLEVSDTGHGMDKIVLEKIFDPYYTTKAKGEGTGLGLSVVHGIVKSLHGDITVYSELGKGTTFHVYFPVVEAEAGKRVKAEVAEQLPSGEEHVLVVDDEETIVKMEQQMLTSLGYQVSAFISCEEALKAFRTQPHTFDLIITDMTMPKITGLQLTKEVLAVRPDIPVILCTGFSELINEEIAREAGICKYLTKPIIKKDLAMAVRKVLDEQTL